MWQRVFDVLEGLDVVNGRFLSFFAHRLTAKSLSTVMFGADSGFCEGWRKRKSVPEAGVLDG
jgi:hypothetical protein